MRHFASCLHRRAAAWIEAALTLSPALTRGQASNRADPISGSYLADPRIAA
jgi:hypothetical protein